jgi:hypothetical protein
MQSSISSTMRLDSKMSLATTLIRMRRQGNLPLIDAWVSAANVTISAQTTIASPTLNPSSCNLLSYVPTTPLDQFATTLRNSMSSISRRN